MNLALIRTEIRRIIAETTAASSYFSDADINSFINDGIKHMCIEAGVYEKTRLIDVVDGDSTYLLPLEFIGMRTLLNPNRIPLDPMSVGEIGSIYTITGLPLNYYTPQEAVSLPIWAVATAYIPFPTTCLVGSTFVVPTTANGYAYECLIAGTSHAATEPTWGTVVGTRQTDGTLTWVCRELFSTLYTLNLYTTPKTANGGTGTYTTIYTAIDEGLYVDTDSPNFPSEKHHYLVSYGAYRCAVKAKDAPLALAFLAEYSSGLGLKMSLPGMGGAEGAT